MFKLQEGATAQETFDIVVTALRKQGKPAYNVIYLYQTDDGCKCAIGHLFPEDAPKEAFKFCGNISGLVSNNIIEFPRDYNLLEDLQRAHDSFARDWDAVFPRQASPVCQLTAGWQKMCAKRLLKAAVEYCLDGKLAQEWLDCQVPV